MTRIMNLFGVSINLKTPSCKTYASLLDMLDDYVSFSDFGSDSE